MSRCESWRRCLWSGEGRLLWLLLLLHEGMPSVALLLLLLQYDSCRLLLQGLMYRQLIQLLLLRKYPPLLLLLLHLMLPRL